MMVAIFNIGCAFPLPSYLTTSFLPTITMPSVHSTPEREPNRRSTVRALMMSPNSAYASSLRPDSELAADTPDFDLMWHYAKESGAQLDIYSNHWAAKEMTAVTALQELEAAEKAIEEEHGAALAEKAEGVRMQNAADRKLEDINLKLQEVARKQVSWHKHCKEAQTHKHCVSYLRFHSATKPLATMAFSGIRGKFKLENAQKVRCLSFIEGMEVLYRLFHLGIEENEDFQGDDPSDDNDNHGTIRRLKKNTTLTELHDRIIRYLQAPELTRPGAIMQPIAAQGYVQNLPTSNTNSATTTTTNSATTATTVTGTAPTSAKDRLAAYKQQAAQHLARLEAEAAAEANQQQTTVAASTASAAALGDQDAEVEERRSKKRSRPTHQEE